MDEKLQMLKGIFGQISDQEQPMVDNSLLRHGNSYSGTYNGRTYYYSKLMIEQLPIDKLERFIKKQIGYEQN